MYQHYNTDAGRREGAVLAAKGTYPVHFMHPSRWEDMPIVRIEEGDGGVLHVTTQGFVSGPHRLHLQHAVAKAA